MAQHLKYVGDKVYNGYDKKSAIVINPGSIVEVSDEKGSQLIADYPSDFQKATEAEKKQFEAEQKKRALEEQKMKNETAKKATPKPNHRLVPDRDLEQRLKEREKVKRERRQKYLAEISKGKEKEGK